MNKIALIIKREYITRVRKRSFIVMTILGPILFAAIIILPAWLAQVEDKGEKIIAIVETNEFNDPKPDSVRSFDVIPNNKNLTFQYVNAPVETLVNTLPSTDYYAILHIPYNLLNTEVIDLYTKKQPSIGIEEYITKSLEDSIYKLKLRKQNISTEVINSAQTNINLKTIKIDKGGESHEQGKMGVKMALGYISGFLIYFFIFFFGSQVMRGVIEEKTNRIIEVIITSVKPFQLMAGKIIGIGLTGLTQFLVWLFLTFGIVFVSQQAFGISKNTQVNEITSQNFDSQYVADQTESGSVPSGEIEELLNQLSEINYFRIIASFLFYFISGFILYGSLFAAIGAAVDSETDTQQFMLPVTIPLMLSIVVMVNAFTNPEGNLAVIFSLIPFTSPVVMMARIGFGIPTGQIILSMAILVITFVFTTWLAGKIYRIGILMYGKKPTYKELWKWVRYKN